jgi:hypothetical protein
MKLVACVAGSGLVHLWLIHAQPEPEALQVTRVAGSAGEALAYARIVTEQVPEVAPAFPPRVGIRLTSAVGGLAPDVIRRFLGYHQFAIARCIRFTHELHVELEIQPDGSVARVEAQGDAPIARCMSRVLGAIDFPRDRMSTRAELRLVMR